MEVPPHERFLSTPGSMDNPPPYEPPPYDDVHSISINAGSLVAAVIDDMQGDAEHAVPTVMAEVPPSAVMAHIQDDQDPIGPLIAPEAEAEGLGGPLVMMDHADMPAPKIKGKTNKKLAPRVTAPRWTENRIKEAARPCYRCNGYGGKCMESRPMTEGGKWAKHNLSPKDMQERGTDKRHCGQCKIPIQDELDRYGVPPAAGAASTAAGGGAMHGLSLGAGSSGMHADALSLPATAGHVQPSDCTPLVDAAVVSNSGVDESVVNSVVGPPVSDLGAPSHSIAPFASLPAPPLPLSSLEQVQQVVHSTLPVPDSFSTLGVVDDSPSKRARLDASFFPNEQASIDTGPVAPMPTQYSERF